MSCATEHELINLQAFLFLKFKKWLQGQQAGECLDRTHSCRDCGEACLVADCQPRSKALSLSMKRFFAEPASVAERNLLGVDNPAAAEKHRQIRLLNLRRDTEEDSAAAGNTEPVKLRPDSCSKEINEIVKGKSELG
jgi:hypothetical protein